MRPASNPGGVGHDWVKRRFLTTGREHGRVFIPASWRDNPHVDHDEYERALSKLDPVTRRQLRDGDWSARAGGKLFKREWFRFLRPHEVPVVLEQVRCWDLAGTIPSKANKDPDWTVGVKGGYFDDRLILTDVKRMRGRPRQVENYVYEVALMDGPEVPVYIGRDPGQAGLSQVEQYQNRVLKGFYVLPAPALKKKEVRWQGLSSRAERKEVYLVDDPSDPWCEEFVDELEAAPYGSHDDQVDAASDVEKYAGSSDAWEEAWGDGASRRSQQGW